MSWTRAGPRWRLPWDGSRQRAFTRVESALFERWIAAALADVVVPFFERHVEGRRRVLDVGAGGARVATRLAGDGDRVVVALDASRAQVRRARRRSAGVATVSVVRGSADALPFTASTFDAVVSSCALKHWPEPAEALVQARRVVRPGGVVVVVEIDGAAGVDEFWNFARTTSVPRLLRPLYVAISMRTVVAVAPDSATLCAALGEVREAGRLEGTPFAYALSVRADDPLSAEE